MTTFDAQGRMTSTHYFPPLTPRQLRMAPFRRILGWLCDWTLKLERGGFISFLISGYRWRSFWWHMNQHGAKRGGNIRVLLFVFCWWIPEAP